MGGMPEFWSPNRIVSSLMAVPLWGFFLRPFGVPVQVVGFVVQLVGFAWLMAVCWKFYKAAVSCGGRTMTTIWKYPLEVKDELTVRMPRGARPLCVQVQNGVPCLWALVDSDASDPEDVRLAWRGTGHDCAGLTVREYVGSVQLFGEKLIFHLFWRKEIV